MSNPETVKETPRILYSCYSHLSREGENFSAHHTLGYILSGSQEVYLGGKTYFFKAGDFRLIRKNQLVRFIKKPAPGGEFKNISIRLDQDTLRSISAENDLHMGHSYTGSNALTLKTSPLLKSYIDSLAPYMDGSGNNNPLLTTLKVKEAVMILLQTDPGLKDMLFDFSEPGKINLEAYMNEHYLFNVDLDRFAYLTGRSIATFKRDFKRIFQMTPSRWIQQKRLNDAYYLIKEKGLKSSDIYLEVGFKDLSHFSFAFKKAYGIAPSRLNPIG
jgi:AraC-like DNA-binding protein